MTFLEMVKGKLTVKITTMNYQIQKLANEDEDKPKYQIGFAIPSNENEEDADEDL